MNVLDIKGHAALIITILIPILTTVFSFSWQLEELLEENQTLDDTHRLPVTEFTVTPRRVAALQDQLLQQ